MTTYQCKAIIPTSVYCPNFRTVDADSPEYAALQYHYDHDFLGFKYSFTNKAGKTEIASFARILVEGQDSYITRVFSTPGISRRGRFKSSVNLPSLEEIANLLDYDGIPESLLEEGWEGEESYPLEY